MGQSQAAAIRKTGIKAHFFYVVFGVISAAYIYIYSIPNIRLNYAAFYDLFVFPDHYLTLTGRQVLQETTLLYAALCASWYVLTASRYSFIRLPFDAPKLNGLALFLLAIYFLCLVDFMVVRDYLHAMDIHPAMLILPFFLSISVLDHLMQVLQRFFGTRWNVFRFLVLPILFVLAPYASLQGHDLTIWVIKVVAVPLSIFAVPVYWIGAREYIKEHPEYRKLFVFGRGGAARWGGIYSFIKYDFNEALAEEKIKFAPIYCGKSLWYDDVKLGGRHIGLDSDSMMLTVAAMGGGKSLYSAWNTLLMWRGGAFVLDPKGEHAGRTAQFRPNGKPIHIIDPWSNVNHLYDGSCATFNPLEEIDITSPNARDEIFQIVESCILHEADENANSKHFRENAQKIMTGVIAHVLTSFPKEHHNLPTIYDIILTGAPDGISSDPKAFDTLVDRMAINEAMGRAPMDAAKVLKEAGENERGGFITTLATGLSWVNTPVLRPVLMQSSFRMKNIKLDRQTVYLVIPFEHMKNHSRFLRTVVSMGLMSCQLL